MLLRTGWPDMYRFLQSKSNRVQGVVDLLKNLYSCRAGKFKGQAYFGAVWPTVFWLSKNFKQFSVHFNRGNSNEEVTSKVPVSPQGSGGPIGWTWSVGQNLDSAWYHQASIWWFDFIYCSFRRRREWNILKAFKQFVQNMLQYHGYCWWSASHVLQIQDFFLSCPYTTVRPRPPYPNSTLSW